MAELCAGPSKILQNVSNCQQRRGRFGRSNARRAWLGEKFRQNVIISHHLPTRPGPRCSHSAFVGAEAFDDCARRRCARANKFPMDLSKKRRNQAAAPPSARRIAGGRKAI
jgi:hypothetical protein